MTQEIRHITNNTKISIRKTQPSYNDTQTPKSTNLNQVRKINKCFTICHCCHGMHLPYQHKLHAFAFWPKWQHEKQGDKLIDCKKLNMHPYVCKIIQSIQAQLSLQYFADIWSCPWKKGKVSKQCFFGFQTAKNHRIALIGEDL